MTEVRKQEIDKIETSDLKKMSMTQLHKIYVATDIGIINLQKGLIETRNEILRRVEKKKA